MRKSHHSGLPSDDSRPGEYFVADTQVWVTDPRTHSAKVEYLRFEPDSPVTGPARDLPHGACRVDRIHEAPAGAGAILEPFQPAPNFSVTFLVKDGAVIESLQSGNESDLPRD